MAHYLCIEAGEKFTVEAKSMAEAREFAGEWGGEAIRKLTPAEEKQLKDKGFVEFAEVE